MTRTKLLFAFALVSVPLAMLTSAPAPSDKLHLTPAGKVKVDNLVVHDAALIGENRVVIVGRTGSIEDTDIGPSEGVASGAIIDLVKKSVVQPFTNQHSSQIWGVSPCGGRLVTSSSELGGTGVLRSWDLKTQESKEVVKLDDAGFSSSLRCFHKSDRVVVDTTERLLVFNPAKPKERLELPCPDGVEFVSSPLAISPDDAWIACSGGRGQVVCFEVATKKATVTRISPKDATKAWTVYGLAFSPSGKLFVSRDCNGKPQVPDGKEEKDVPAERRGIVRIDLPDGKVVPLNMDHTVGAPIGAVDGKERWLAAMGVSRSDKKAGHSVPELRVHNLASGKLAYREQLEEGLGAVWVRFTPSGQRLVSVTYDGMVRWWDVPKR